MPRGLFCEDGFLKTVFGFRFSVFGKRIRKRSPRKMNQETIKRSRSFKDLEVWKLAVSLVKAIYQITGKFPASENFGLTNQIRRSAVSIPSNIAEGQGRNSSKEFRQFLSISLGSLGELETQLIIAKEIEYLTIEELNPLLASLDRIRKMMKSLSNSIK